MSDEHTTALVAMEPESKLQTLESFAAQREKVQAFVQAQLKKDTDYGIIPGTKKMSLLQPGAEKILQLFQCSIELECVREVEDFDHGFFYYKYRATVIHTPSGRTMIKGLERSCSSKETKYATRKVWDNKATAEDIANGKKFTSTYQGRTSTYYIVKRTSDELAEDINTYQSMAQKRCVVAATRIVTGATDLFEDDDGSDERPPQGGKNGRNVKQPVGQRNDNEPPLPSEPQHNSLRDGFIKRLFATAGERGFTDKRVTDAIHKRYKVASTNDLADTEIREFTNLLIENYAIVEKGQEPKKIGAPAVPPKQTGNTSPVTVEEGTVVSEPTQPEVMMCYTCKKNPAKIDDPDLHYYCSQKCKDSYYKTPANSLQDKLAKGFTKAQ